MCLRFIRFRARGEDIENQTASVEHFTFKNLLKVSDLNRVQIIVEDDELDRLIDNEIVNLFDLALADKCRGVNAVPILAYARNHLSAGRIGEKFLKAGIGFGGSCFKKDILNLVYLCNYYGLQEVAAYWESVVKINEYQQERFIANVLKSMFSTLAGKKICILGFAFKANTGDTRESPAIYISKKMLAEHAEVIISDPKALKNAAMDLAGIKGNVKYIEDPYRAAADCHALVILTDWDLYQKLDFQKIYSAMAKPAFLFDGRNIIDHKKCFAIGFNVYPIGKPALSHFKN